MGGQDNRLVDHLRNMEDPALHIRSSHFGYESIQ